MASLIAQLVKNLPAVGETWVRSLGQEDTLEKGKATHSIQRRTVMCGAMFSSGLSRYKGTYLQNGNRHTEIEDKLMVIQGVGER